MAKKKKNKRIDELTKEKIRQHYAISNNYRATARQFKISDSTVARIIKKSGDFEQIKADKKKEIKEEADKWSSKIIEDMQESIASAVLLGNKKIRQALEGDEKIDALIDKILDADIDQKDKGVAIRMLSNMLNIGLRDISTYVGTLYDKQALANGQATSRSDNMNRNTIEGEVKVKLEDFFTGSDKK